MIVVDKMQAWQALQERFSRVVDRIGERIDLGIMDAVVSCNATGLYTTASCEGHLDHGLAYPWIDVSCEEAEDLAHRIAVLLHTGKREDAETKRLMQEHRYLLLQGEQRLVAQLHSFYQSRPFDYDRHLSIWSFGNGKPRLQSHGAEYQQFRDDAEKTQKLKEYQGEMAAFASFLKERFFASEELP